MSAKDKDRYQDIKILHIGSPMLLGGKNFPERLDVDKWPGLEIVYDKVERSCTVTWNKESAEVPMFIYKIPGKSKYANRIVQTDAPIVPLPGPKVTAQVSGPTHHVFAGPGAGKTGQEE